jgi:hypothetical protein
VSHGQGFYGLRRTLLLGLAITAISSGGWWVDPVIALGSAAWAVVEGRDGRRGDACGC